MTESFVPPADVAEAIIRQVLELRGAAHRKAHAGDYSPLDTSHLFSSMREDTLLECLGLLLGVQSDSAVDAFIIRWAAERGMELDEAAVRVRAMPTARDLHNERARAAALDDLRSEGARGLSKTALTARLSTGPTTWRGESEWLAQWLREGTVVARRRGNGTNYVHRDFASPHSLPLSEATRWDAVADGTAVIG
ncbi:hypothetical protein ACFVFS_33860 [Kitasatospora sp. NPDC057692]|uniref:hypothetical protein n=1 Tax=Kitasatospora sp. NPDC057692 TaxID=3346215 RepID=UPI003675B296